MLSSGYLLGVSWIDRQQTLSEFVEAAVAYLRKIQPLHQLFGGPLFLTGSSRQEFEPVAPNLSNIESFTKRFGWNRRADDEPHTGVLPDRTMSGEGTSRLGFDISINSSGLGQKPNGIGVSVSGGMSGTNLSSDAIIAFPNEGWPEFERLEFVKQLLDVTVRCFNPERGYVTSVEFFEAQGLSKAGYAHAIGWLNYFANPAVRRDLPPDVECESFGPGGVLLTLQHERPSADDAQAVARAKAIREALLPGNWFEFEKLRKPAAAA